MKELNEAERIFEDWQGVINDEEYPQIKESYRKKVTAILLENSKREGAIRALHEDPTNVVTDGTGQMKKWDPVLISMIRRAMPNIIAYDIAGVQPMTGPTGLIFAMKSTYRTASKATGTGAADRVDAGDEALFDEADSSFSGYRSDLAIADMSDGDGTGVVFPYGDPTTPSANQMAYGKGITTAYAEGWGYASQTFAEMGFTISKVEVGVRSRGLKATYSVELAQDMKAVHGLDADTELANILSTEILAEINREVIRRAYWTAKKGAIGNTTDGVFDLDTDSNGRWSVERFKGLMFQIEKDCNAIAIATRRGKGNFIICSANVASALAMTNMLDTGGKTSLTGVVDPVGDLFAGMLNGRTKVFVDPFLTADVVLVGYKGANAYDAGMFYCPYVPLTIYRTVGEDDFQPRIGFKTRYGMVTNPFTGAGDGTFVDGGWATSPHASGGNAYYRLFRVSNLG